MNEADFWSSLEYRVCREFGGMPEKNFQSLWCDGFIPNQYLLNDPKPRITGRAWIGNGLRQAEWDFTFLLPRPFDSREEIEWETLLPAENVTCWLAVDEATRQIEMEPAVAIPDESSRSAG